MHGIPLARCIGRGTGGLEKLRDEIQSQNEGFVIPMSVIWLGCLPDIRERAETNRIVALLIIFMAKGEKLANRIIWDGFRILNRHYRVETFIEARPDTICGVCSGWGHGEHSCAFPKHPRCALCEDEHQFAGRAFCCPPGCRCI